MKKLNVIDLDKTYVIQDSFKHFIKSNMTFPMIGICFLRAVNLYSHRRFAELSQLYLKNSLEDCDKIREVISWCKLNTNKSVVSKCHDFLAQDNTVNIILSASPHSYVSKFATESGFHEGFGSKFLPNGEYFHLFGKNKIQFLLDIFPKREYFYNFSISDSLSDRELLKMFKYGYLYTNNCFEELK